MESCTVGIHKKFNPFSSGIYFPTVAFCFLANHFFFPLFIFNKLSTEFNWKINLGFSLFKIGIFTQINLLYIPMKGRLFQIMQNAIIWNSHGNTKLRGASSSPYRFE